MHQIRSINFAGELNKMLGTTRRVTFAADDEGNMDVVWERAVSDDCYVPIPDTRMLVPAQEWRRAFHLLGQEMLRKQEAC